MSVLSGTTVIDQNTTINGSSIVGLESPGGMSLYGIGENESLIAIDFAAKQIIHMKNINSNNSTISIIVRKNTNMTRFFAPYFIFLNTQHSIDLYVSDYIEGFVVLFSSIQTTNPLPRKVAGINQTIGSGLYEIRNARGIAID